jgi:DNA-binding transcriptional regulator YiaG
MNCSKEPAPAKATQQKRHFCAPPFKYRHEIPRGYRKRLVLPHPGHGIWLATVFADFKVRPLNRAQEDIEMEETNNQNRQGCHVRTLRQRLAMTQEEFAHCLGITVSTVNRWENGHSSPSKLARASIVALGEKNKLHVDGFTLDVTEAEPQPQYVATNSAYGA